MGHRAAFMVREGGRERYWYGHWAALSLDLDLFWGPEHALRGIERCQLVDSYWPAGDEGGAVIDVDERTLLWWGGEQAGYELPFRRVLLEALRATWPGWTVTWAHGGRRELAAVCREPFAPEGRIRPGELRAPDPDRSRAAGEDWVTVDWGGRVTVLYAHGGMDHDFFPTPDGLDADLAGRGLPRVEVPRWFPLCAGHVDVDARVFRWWHALPVEHPPEDLAALWPGWTVIDDQDAFEPQLGAARGALVVPLPTREEARAELGRSLRRFIDRPAPGRQSVVPVDEAHATIDRVVGPA